jgi:glycosyltransferase involved in cell wall biosynthesis
MTKNTPETVTVVMPVLDDWTSCRGVLLDLDRTLAGRAGRHRVLLVDDGSRETHEESLGDLALESIEEVEILRLTRNLGHQRAIAIGLSHVARDPPDLVVVMDADGEDQPRDVPRLLDRAVEGGGEEIVFAARARRAEGLFFRFFYVLYRMVHRALVGHGVRVGNFSVVPRRRLRSIVTVSELWSHYAAAVFVSRQPHTSVLCVRGRRIDGASRMNFVALVMHGLGAISVFCDIVAVRLLIATGLLGGLATAGMLASLGVRLLSAAVLPGWSSLYLGVFFIILLQLVLFAFSLTFTILNRRSARGFLPSRDCPYFIDGQVRVFPRSGPPGDSRSA